VVNIVDWAALWGSLTTIATTGMPTNFGEVATIGGAFGLAMWMLYRITERNAEDARKEREITEERIRAQQSAHTDEKKQIRDGFIADRDALLLRMDGVEKEAAEARSAAAQALATQHREMATFVERQLESQHATEQSLAHVAQMADRLAVGQTGVHQTLRTIIEQRPCLFSDREELMKILGVREQSLLDGLHPDATPERLEDQENAK